MNTAIAVIPKLVVTVEGKVKKSNLPDFQEAAKKYVSQINREFNTDEDFGQAEKDVKALKEAEKLVKTEIDNVIGQTHDINEVLKTLKFIGEEFRTPRLEIEKEVKEQKDSIRIKLMKDATDEVSAYALKQVELINKDFAIELSYDGADFYAAIKGLRTIDSVKENIKKEKDKAIFSIAAVINDILAKLTWFKDNGYMEHKDLFRDIAEIIYNEIEGFKAMVQLRVTNHIAAEKKKEDDLREEIRIQEEAKATAKAEAEVKAKAEAEAKTEVKKNVEEQAIANTVAITVPSDFPKIEEVKTDPDTPLQNDEHVRKVLEARKLCDTFLALTMRIDELESVRFEMTIFLEKTDWMDE